jgi:hypothetical protein
METICRVLDYWWIIDVERRANCDRRPGYRLGVSWLFHLTVYIEAQQPTLIRQSSP